MPNEPDVDLLRRFVRGDRDAFESLFHDFAPEVYRWVVRIVRDPSGAEDAVIETFWRAYRGRARFDPSRSFGAWMRQIATNVARDQLRAARHRPGRTIAEPAALPTSPCADPDLANLVALAFRALSPKLQIVATLALIEGQPYAEIAHALGVPLGTVKSRVSRAVDALRRELSRLGIRR